MGNGKYERGALHTAGLTLCAGEAAHAAVWRWGGGAVMIGESCNCYVSAQTTQKHRSRCVELPIYMHPEVTSRCATCVAHILQAHTHTCIQTVCVHPAALHLVLLPRGGWLLALPSPSIVLISHLDPRAGRAELPSLPAQQRRCSHLLFTGFIKTQRT